MIRLVELLLAGLLVLLVVGSYAHRAASGLDSWDSKPIGAGD